MIIVDLAGAGSVLTTTKVMFVFINYCLQISDI